MKQADLERMIEAARDAADEAAKLVMQGFRRGVVVEEKHANDLVTQYDRASEALLRKRLSADLPYAVVGEEAGGSPKDGIGLYVDPIDGTTNYVHGHPVWCISIGLMAHGAPIAGYVLAPVLGIEWAGWVTAHERAATRAVLGNRYVEEAETPCHVSKVDKLEDAYLATGFPYDRKTTTDDNFNAFFHIKKRCQAIRRCGSAAIDLCLVGDGTYDGYWERRVQAYDVAAGASIVRAAGGHVSDFEGTPGFLAGTRIVATNGHLHTALLAELAVTG